MSELTEPLAPEIAVSSIDEARIEMVHDLHRAVHGATWARPQPPVTVWRELLAVVRRWSEADAEFYEDDEPVADVVRAFSDAVNVRGRTLGNKPPWPPPAKGMHESDLCDAGVLCCRYCAAQRDYTPALTDVERTEFLTAVEWSRSR